MKRTWILALSAIFSVFLTACGVTPVFEIPLPPKSAVSAELSSRLTGSWKSVQKEASDPRITAEVAVRNLKPQNEMEAAILFARLLISEKDKASKKEVMRPLPVVLIPFRLEERNYVLILADPESICKTGNLSGYLVYMTAPKCIVAEFSGEGDDVTVDLLSWTKPEKQQSGLDKEVPVSDKVVIRCGYVMNPPNEVLDFLKQRIYRKALQFKFLKVNAAEAVK